MDAAAVAVERILVLRTPRLTRFITAGTSRMKRWDRTHLLIPQKNSLIRRTWPLVLPLGVYKYTYMTGFVFFQAKDPESGSDLFSSYYCKSKKY